MFSVYPTVDNNMEMPIFHSCEFGVACCGDAVNLAPIM